MKVLQVVPHYIPATRFGGPQNVAHNLSKALVNKGHSVTICTTNMENETTDLDVPLDKKVDIDGVNVYYEPVIISRYWGLSPKMAQRIWLESQWADIIFIHFHYQYCSFIGGLISRIQKKPYLIFTHGSLNRYGINARNRYIKRAYLRVFESHNFRKALFVAYHSQEELENSIQLGKSFVVPNGISPENMDKLPQPGYFLAKYPILKGKKLILFFGRIDAGKGLDILLPAFAELCKKQSDVYLIIAGADERGYEQVVRMMAGKLGIAEKITFTGLLSGDDKLGVLQDSDVFILPSRSEGLSIAMLEAMYMGLPVIVTDRVGLWRSIEQYQCGYTVTPDIEKLSEAIEKMLNNTDRESMGQRGQRLVEAKYTWSSIVNGLVNQLQHQINCDAKIQSQTRLPF